MLNYDAAASRPAGVYAQQVKDPPTLLGEARVRDEVQENPPYLSNQY